MKASRRNNALTIVILFLVVLILSAKYGFKKSFEYAEALDAKSEESADIGELLTGEFYYYSSSGQKYHFDPGCRYLKNSKNVTQSDKYYLQAEMRKPCSACAGGSGEEDDAEEPSNIDENVSANGEFPSSGTSDEKNTEAPTGEDNPSVTEASTGADNPSATEASTDSELPSGNGQGSGSSDKGHTGVIYYTKSGTKYHLSKDCRYLKRSKEILQGGQDIIKSRKLTPCSACAQ